MKLTPPKFLNLSKTSGQRNGIMSGFFKAGSRVYNKKQFHLIYSGCGVTSELNHCTSQEPSGKEVSVVDVGGQPKELFQGKLTQCRKTEKST